MSPRLTLEVGQWAVNKSCRVNTVAASPVDMVTTDLVPSCGTTQKGIMPKITHYLIVENTQSDPSKLTLAVVNMMLDSNDPGWQPLGSAFSASGNDIENSCLYQTMVKYEVEKSEVGKSIESSPPKRQFRDPDVLTAQTSIVFRMTPTAGWTEWMHWEPGPTYNPPEVVLRRVKALYPTWDFRIEHGTYS
jgi:hypothetical protein